MENERIDRLNGEGLCIIQHEDVFCLSTDSVLLADFASPKRHDRICDLGCGTGGIALLMASHALQADPDTDIRISGIELQEAVCDMAQRSVRMNRLEDIIDIVCGDIRSAPIIFGRETMNLCVCNPPYGKLGAVLHADNTVRDIARHESFLSPEELCGAAFSLLRIGGRFCVIYPAERAFGMMQAMSGARLAPKRVRTVHNRACDAPKLVLIEAVKLGGEGLIWLPPLFMREEDGSATKEMKRIYREDRL